MRCGNNSPGLNRTANKCWPRWIACYLALSLVLASFASISPTWHAWLDHGGGPMHTHSANGKMARAHSHPHPHPHPHPKELKFEDFLPRPILGAGKRLKSPATTLPEEGAPHHTHQTLSQLLLSGAMEGAVTLIAPRREPVEFAFISSFPQSGFIASDWNTQTSGRGPPSLLPIL